MATDDQIVWIIQSAPRLGFSDDISLLASSDTSSRQQYVTGVIIFAIQMVLPFVLLGFGLLFTKYHGHLMHCKKCSSSISKNGKKNKHKWAIIRQKVFLFAASAGVVATSFMEDWCINVVDESIRKITLANDEIAMHATLGIESINKIVSSQYSLNSHREKAFTCIHGTSQDVIELSSMLNGIDNFIYQTIASAKRSLEELIEYSTYFDLFLERILIYHDKLRVFFVILITVIIFLSIGVFFEMVGLASSRYRYIQTNIFLPLLISLAVFLCAVFFLCAAATLMNSDFCTSPDETMVSALNRISYANSSFSQSITDFIENCQKQKPGFLSDIQMQTEQAFFVGSLLEGQIKPVECPNIGYFTFLLDDLDTISSNLGWISKQMGCNNTYNLYSRVAHDEICSGSLSGTVWMFRSLLFVFICIMVMITLHSAWHATERYDKYSRAIKTELKDYQCNFNEYEDEIGGEKNNVSNIRSPNLSALKPRRLPLFEGLTASAFKNELSNDSQEFMNTIVSLKTKEKENALSREFAGRQRIRLSPIIPPSSINVLSNTHSLHRRSSHRKHDHKNSNVAAYSDQRYISLDLHSPDDRFVTSRNDRKKQSLKQLNTSSLSLESEMNFNENEMFEWREHEYQLAKIADKNNNRNLSYSLSSAKKIDFNCEDL